MMDLQFSDNDQICYTKQTEQGEVEFFSSLPVCERLVKKYGRNKALMNTWNTDTLETGYFRIVPMGGNHDIPCIINSEPDKQGAFKAIICKQY